MQPFNLRTSQIRNVSFGANVSIVEPVNFYECNLGDDVFIGPFVEIQSGVVIGCSSRIQSHSFICSGVTIGKHCFVGHGVMFINDTFSIGRPANNNRSLWKNTVISDRVCIGSNATILPVSICSDVVIGAGSVVTNNITVKGVYAGNPARILKSIY